MKATYLMLSIVLMAGLLTFTLLPQAAMVFKDKSKVMIVDQTGELWDVTQAASIGFDPKGFQYGIGKDAFKTLDADDLTESAVFANDSDRVLGVTNGEKAHAYFISKLRYHEIANTELGKQSIAAAY